MALAEPSAIQGSSELKLHEVIVLLALQNRGAPARSVSYQCALGGGILAELVLSDRVGAADPAYKRVRVLDATPLASPLLSECLAIIGRDAEPLALETWIRRFARMGKVLHKAAGDPCRRGVLQTVQTRYLYFFRRTSYPEVDPEPKKEILARIRKPCLRTR